MTNFLFAVGIHDCLPGLAYSAYIEWILILTIVIIIIIIIIIVIIIVIVSSSSSSSHAC